MGQSEERDYLFIVLLLLNFFRQDYSVDIYGWKPVRLSLRLDFWGKRSVVFDEYLKRQNEQA